MNSRLIAILLSWATATTVLAVAQTTGGEASGGSAATSEFAAAARRRLPTAKVIYAVVDQDGTLIDGKGVVAAESPGPGTYFVVFDRDVSGCAYLATLRTSLAANFAVTPRSSQTRAVLVSVFNDGGAGVERAFQLVVAC
jgi:hypothetical protein